jgi:Fe-S-cluster containining protein
MLRLDPDQRRQLADALAQARSMPALAAELDRVYADFELERARQSPRCDQSGRCCRFESYGHRLFVTGIELAVFGQRSLGLLPPVPWDGTGCPYQQAGRCEAHLVRPFGCRVYFCDPSADAWQQDQYERFHARIRELHEKFGVPYWYVEWREGLAVLGVEPTPQLTPQITPHPTSPTGQHSLPILGPADL